MVHGSVMQLRVREIAPIVSGILEVRERVSPQRSVVVAVSGIDGSGKGWVAQRLIERLQMAGQNVAAITADAWLNLPEIRFSRTEPARHFYRHAIRFDQMFADVLNPLRECRSIRATVDVVEETAHSSQTRTVDFADVDVVIVEGIYLLRKSLRVHYDYSVWVNCTFETAMERAIARAQEDLSPLETTAAYQRIYFPAQRIHFFEDDPLSAATIILDNDPRLNASAREPGAGESDEG